MGLDSYLPKKVKPIWYMDCGGKHSFSQQSEVWPSYVYYSDLLGISAVMEKENVLKLRSNAEVGILTIQELLCQISEVYGIY